MHRSLSALPRLATKRAFSASPNSNGSTRVAPASTASSAASAPSTVASAKQAPPPPPPPPPSPPSPSPPPKTRRGRILFAAIMVPVAAGAYRMHTDADFRASVDNVLPGASAALARVTGANYGVKGNKSRKDDFSTLPPHFESIPEILAKIERKREAEETESEAEVQDNVQMSKKKDASSASHQKHVTPSSRAAAKVAAQKAGIPPKRDAVEAPTHEETRASPPVLSEKKSEHANMDKKKVHVEEEKDIQQKAQVDDETTLKKELLPIPGSSSAPHMESMDAKAKMARIFGKPQLPVSADDQVSAETKEAAKYEKPVPRPKPKLNESTKIYTTADVAALESELKVLRKELETQANWEAVRIQKAVYAQLLADKESAAKEGAQMARKHKEALEKVQEESLANAEKLVEIRTREIEHDTALKRDRELKEMLVQKEKEILSAMELKFLERERQQAVDRERKLREAEARVNALVGHFSTLLEHNKASVIAADTASATYALCNAIVSDRPFENQVKQVANTTDLAEVVVQSIPAAARQRGVPTVAQLQERFSSVARHGLGEAMVPDEKAGTLWGQLLGAVMSRLKIHMFDSAIADGSADQDLSDEERIRRAQVFVQQGDISRATEILRTLKAQLPKDIVSDWLADASARCAADQAAHVLYADTIIAQVAIAAAAHE